MRAQARADCTSAVRRTDVKCYWTEQLCGGNNAALDVTGGCAHEHVSTVQICAYCKTLLLEAEKDG